MELQDLRDRVCIIGVGDTPQGAVPNKTGDEFAIDHVVWTTKVCQIQQS